MKKISTICWIRSCSWSNSRKPTSQTNN